MKKSIAFWSLTIPVLVFTIWMYQSDKSCVAHTERTHCQSPFIPQMLAAAVIEKPERVNFQFNVGTRFNAINKDVVQSSTHVKAFLPNCNTDEAVAYTKVTVSILDDDRITDRSVEGTSPQLNSDQLALLAEADYSDNILIRPISLKRVSKQVIWRKRIAHPIELLPLFSKPLCGRKYVLIKLFRGTVSRSFERSQATRAQKWKDVFHNHR